MAVIIQHDCVKYISRNIFYKIAYEKKSNQAFAKHEYVKSTHYV